MKQTNDRILVVTADRPFMNFVHELLRLSGYAVALANNGREAVRTMRTILIDGVVLDHSTPFAEPGCQSSTPDTLQAIRNVNPFVPVLLACASRSTIDDWTLSMADVVLETPVKDSALLEAVGTVLNEPAGSSLTGLRSSPCER